MFVSPTYQSLIYQLVQLHLLSCIDVPFHMHTCLLHVLVFYRITGRNPAVRTGGGRVGLPRVFTVAASDARIGYVTCSVLELPSACCSYCIP